MRIKSANIAETLTQCQAHSNEYKCLLQKWDYL